jgi:hypothetical protein
MSRIRSILVGTPLVVASFATGCGGTVVGGQGSEDSGAPDAREHRPDAPPPPVDGGRADRSPPPVDSGVPGDAAEGGVPGSTMLAPGDNYILWGVTSDGYAVYSTATLSTTTVYAVPLAGGTPLTVDELTTPNSEVIVGGYSTSTPFVFVLNDMQSTGLGTLKTWSGKGGLSTIASKAYAYDFAVSSDAKTIAYFANFDSSAQTADVYAANIDGTGAALLQSGVTAGYGIPGTCYTELSFAAESVVLGYCAPSTFSGSIFSFAGASWTKTTVASGIYPYFSVDPSGANLLVVSSGGLGVVPVSGGAPTIIDPTGQGGAFTSDGSTVVYITTSGGLSRSKVTSPSPTVLVTSGVSGIYGLSPDDSTALVYDHYDSATYVTDLYAASAVKKGPLTTLSKATTASVSSGGISGVVLGSPFTADSSHVLFYTGVSTASYPYLGTLQSSGLGSTPPVTLGTKTNVDWASGKTKVVFEDDFSIAAGSLVATIDIKSIDTAAGGSPTLVVSQANAGAYFGSFYLSPDGTQIVYAQNGTKGSKSGVYVLPVP